MTKSQNQTAYSLVLRGTHRNSKRISPEKPETPLLNNIFGLVQNQSRETCRVLIEDALRTKDQSIVVLNLWLPKATLLVYNIFRTFNDFGVATYVSRSILGKQSFVA